MGRAQVSLMVRPTSGDPRIAPLHRGLSARSRVPCIGAEGRTLRLLPGVVRVQGAATRSGSSTPLALTHMPPFAAAPVAMRGRRRPRDRASSRRTGRAGARKPGFARTSASLRSGRALTDPLVMRAQRLGTFLGGAFSGRRISDRALAGHSPPSRASTWVSVGEIGLRKTRQLAKVLLGHRPADLGRGRRRQPVGDLPLGRLCAAVSLVPQDLPSLNPRFEPVGCAVYCVAPRSLSTMMGTSVPRSALGSGDDSRGRYFCRHSVDVLRAGFGGSASRVAMMRLPYVGERVSSSATSRRRRSTSPSRARSSTFSAG